MQDQRISRGEKPCNPCLTSAEEDASYEGTVLALVLDEHAAHLTVPELSRAMNGAGDFSAEDAVERAIRDLVGAGLLQIVGGLVLPTRAALYFDALELG